MHWIGAASKVFTRQRATRGEVKPLVGLAGFGIGTLTSMTNAPPGPEWGYTPLQGALPSPPKPRSSVTNWVKRNKLVVGAGGLVAVVVLALIGLGIYHSLAPANDLLPATPNGWTRLATLSDSQSSEIRVTLHGVQLQICWVTKSGSIASLAYAIGDPAAGPTPLYGEYGSQSSNGCVYDPGNDTGSETFAVYESGIGNYAVSLNEQLTPSQEAALNRQAAQQAARQAQQQQAQAAAQARANAESNVNRAAQTVASDLNNVTGDISSVNSDVSGVNAALQQEQTDLATTQQASAAVVRAGNNSATGGSSCGNANNVQGDANNVQGNANDVQGALNPLPNVLSQLQGDLSSLESDQQAYQSVASSVGGYTSSAEPSPANIASAEAAAQAAIKTGTSVNAAGMTGANQLVAQANAAAQTAENAGC